MRGACPRCDANAYYEFQSVGPTGVRCKQCGWMGLVPMSTEERNARLAQLLDQVGHCLDAFTAVLRVTEAWVTTRQKAAWLAMQPQLEAHNQRLAEERAAARAKQHLVAAQRAAAKAQRQHLADRVAAKAKRRRLAVERAAAKRAAATDQEAP